MTIPGLVVYCRFPNNRDFDNVRVCQFPSWSGLELDDVGLARWWQKVSQDAIDSKAPNMQQCIDVRDDALNWLAERGLEP